MTEKTLIIGSGNDARDVAEKLLSSGTPIILATAEKADAAGWVQALGQSPKGAVEVLPVNGILGCTGSAGRFEVIFGVNGNTAKRIVADIVLADDGHREPNFSLYGLTPCPAVVSLSQAKTFLEAGSGPAAALSSAQKTVFITGLGSESSPVIAGEIMGAALELQQTFHHQTYILTGNLKVAGNGLEALYQETKKAGTIYVKFTETLPEIRQTAHGQVSVIFVDEITRQGFRLTPDVIVVDETPMPSENIPGLAGILQLDTGPDGFPQSDNVHRVAVATNRQGVFVAGSARGGGQSREACTTDACIAALSVIKLREQAEAPPAGKAEIKKGQCVGCLTCYRICPYHAIVLNGRPLVSPQACEGCGICVAECPCFAITIEAPDNGPVADRIVCDRPASEDRDFVPAITAFCCSRSAAGAWELATCEGQRLPQGLRVISVPCGGGIALEHLLAAFRKGADGVLVLTCHTGNCHSENGNRFAGQRVARTWDLLPQVGLEPERLSVKTLASNMGAGFTETVIDFEQSLLALGPNKLGRD